MKLSTLLNTIFPCALVAVYTFNYGRWAARQKLTRGAVGLYILALATIAVPAFAVWWTS